MAVEFDTKYPILLVHGTGFRDRKSLNYWGRVPKVLIDGGARVYYGHQDAWGILENNAQIIANSLDEALSDSGAERVNIIAHSKGGLEARYLISTLGYADKVASLTTISSPHYGTKTMDSIMKIPAFLFKFAGIFVDLWFRILGDKKPSFYLGCLSFTTHYATEFNNQNPNSPTVYYQSYAGAMKHSRSDMLMFLVHAVVKRKDGENDGLVPVESAKWGEFKGVVRGQGARGVSHADEVDMRRRNFKRKPKQEPEGYNDMREFYKKIVKELKDAGF